MNSTSAVAVSIQAVSPEFSTGASSANASAGKSSNEAPSARAIVVFMEAPRGS